MNYGYQFILGLWDGISGGTKKWESCVPKIWRSSTLGEKQPKSDIFKKGRSLIKPFKKVLNLVVAGVKILCRFKAESKDAFSKLVNRKFFRRMRFAQKESPSVKGAIKNEGKSVKKGVKKSKGIAKKLGKDVLKKIVKKTGKNIGKFLHTLKKLWRLLKKFIKRLTASLSEFLRSKFIAHALQFVECLGKKQKNEEKALKEKVVIRVRGFVRRTKTIIQSKKADGPGVVIGVARMVLDLLCNFKQFQDGIGFLEKSIKEKEKSQKYSFLGRFFGKFIFAVGND